MQTVRARRLEIRSRVSVTTFVVGGVYNHLGLANNKRYNVRSLLHKLLDEFWSTINCKQNKVASESDETPAPHAASSDPIRSL